MNNVSITLTDTFEKQTELAFIIFSDEGSNTSYRFVFSIKVLEFF